MNPAIQYKNNAIAIYREWSQATKAGMQIVADAIVRANPAFFVKGKPKHKEFVY